MSGNSVVRTDFLIDAEGRSLLLADASVAGLELQASEVWTRCVEDRLMVPFALNEKFSVGVRVVVGELTPIEQDAWVGRLRCRVRVPSGQLIVASGTRELADAVKGCSDASIVLEIPGGEHDMSIHTLVTAINARWCLMRADGVGWDGQEQPGEWFRRTRPGEPFPQWLRALCVVSPDSDPGHEEEWDELYDSEGEALEECWETRPWVDHLIQLTPPGPALETPPLDAGLMHETEVRRPPRCPDSLPRE